MEKKKKKIWINFKKAEMKKIAIWKLYFCNWDIQEKAKQQQK